jgi:peroxiredoxin
MISDGARSMETRRTGWLHPNRLTLGFLALAIVAGIGASVIYPLRTTKDRRIGRPVADFTLLDTSGRPVSLHRYRRKKAVVLVFMGTECPVGNLYMSRLVELSRAYGDKGVAFLIINANAHESTEAVAEHARAYQVTFPVLKDEGNRVADRLEIERTCETLLLDGHGRLRYRGAIDDQYDQGRRKAAPSRSYLVEALDAVLAGREPPVPITTVVGCPLDRVDPIATVKNRPRVRSAAPAILSAFKESEAPVAVGRVTYAADVAPILEAKCQSCHRPGQVGPFSLLTYPQARRWAASIREVVAERRMPPWHADPRFGHFANDRSLTDRHRATLLAWVEQGTPPGDLESMPAPKTFPEGWTIGKPDLVVPMAEPFTVPAQGSVPYKHFRVPTGFTEDRWVQAAEARPGDRSVVHHIGVYVDDHDPKSSAAEPHMKRVVALYFPGENSPVFPPGIARRIPAGSDLIFEVHYTPIGIAKTDQSSVGMIFAREPVAHVAHMRGIPDKKLRIPPGAANHPVRSSYTFPNDSHLLTLMPHMHIRGKDFLYVATYPDGRSETLLSVPAYDFGWQSIYILAEPKVMPRGTRIDCLAHFDNSESNPDNPDPEKEVTWGEQTWEEMMIGYIDYYEDARPTSLPPTLESRRPTNSRLR